MAKEPIAVLTADWHIRKNDRVWVRLPNLHGDAAWSVQQILDISERFDVHSILLGGDILDKQAQPADATLVLRRTMDYCQQRDHNVYYVQGQHELSSPPWLKALHDWPQHVHGQTVELHPGIQLTGLDYRPPDKIEEAARGIADVDVLLTHQVWKDFMGDDRGDAWFEWVPDSISVIATGDFHRTEVRELPRPLSSPHGQRPQLAVSPGSICMQSIDEPPVKFVYILFDDLSVEPIQLITRQFFRALISTEEELQQFVDGWQDHSWRVPQADVPPEISINLMRLSYREDLVDARERIERAVGNSVHLVTEPIAVESLQLDADAQVRHEAVEAGGLEGCINAFYSENPRVAQSAVRINRAEDVDAEIRAVFKEMISDER